MSPDFAEPLDRAKLDIFLYGPPGSGKTTAACSAPGPILVLNAEPGNPLRFARHRHGKDAIRELPVTGASTLLEAYLYLKDGEGGEQTVVVDSLSEVYRAVLRDFSGGHRPQIQHYLDTQTKIEDYCRTLIDLPQNVVLIAHEGRVKDEDEGYFERLPLTGTKNPALGGKLMAMVDIVAYCGRAEPEAEGESDRFLGQLYDGNGRRGKDRGLAGREKFEELNLTAWVEAEQAALAAAEESNDGGEK